MICNECHSTIHDDYRGACVSCLRRENERLRNELADTHKGIDAMKEGVGIRIGDLQAENERLRNRLLTAEAHNKSARSMMQQMQVEIDDQQDENERLRGIVERGRRRGD